MQGWLPTDDANIVAESIVYANVRGKHAWHWKITDLCQKIMNGLMDERTTIETVGDNKTVSILDANHGLVR